MPSFIDYIKDYVAPQSAQSAQIFKLLSRLEQGNASFAGSTIGIMMSIAVAVALTPVTLTLFTGCANLLQGLLGRAGP